MATLSQIRRLAFQALFQIDARGEADIDAVRDLLEDGEVEETFTESEIFAPAATDDTGEAAAIVAGDVTGNGTSIVIVAPAEPAESANRAHLRRYDWQR